MTLRVRPAESGTKAVYAEHGIWFDSRTRHVHVALGGEHWSYPRTHPRYATYKRVLEAANRWPEGAPEPE